MKGIVKWFNKRKGYGHIRPLDGQQGDIFVHFSAIEGTGYKNLQEGELVEFDVEDIGKGPRAKNVMVRGFR